MSSALTGLVFAAATILLIWRHMKKVSGGGAAGNQETRCPRCPTIIPPGSLACPRCRVPLQVYDLVTLAPVTGNAEPAPADARHPLVRGDLCVGCGTCVDACPEPGALTMREKRVVVDRTRCVGHGHCIEACPVGALILTTGEAVQRITVPLLNVHFETNVSGVYVVGELGGRGLIKNAVNEGKLAVEHVSRRIDTGWDETPVLDLIIVGTGPAGLSAGLEAQRLGLSYLVLERGDLVDTIRKYPRHKLLLAEPVKVPLYGDLWIADASKEDLLRVWEKVIAESHLRVRTRCEVTDIRRCDSHLQVRTAKETFATRTVILALGRRGTPRRLDVPGEDLPHVVYDIAEMEPFSGRRVLVVGGGDSAVESAVGLSHQHGTNVTLSYRGERFGRIKARNREKLDAAVAAHRIDLLLESHVRAIEKERAHIEQRSTTRWIPVDDVVIRCGGVPPYDFLERIGVRLVQKELAIGASQEGSHASG